MFILLQTNWFVKIIVSNDVILNLLFRRIDFKFVAYGLCNFGDLHAKQSKYIVCYLVPVENLGGGGRKNDKTLLFLGFSSAAQQVFLVLIQFT